VTPEPETARPPSPPSLEWSPERLVLFSDGVFAIALTLLVLDLQVPTDSQGSLYEALRGDWPSYLAFILSFARVANCWAAHHVSFSRYRRINLTVIWLNFGLLFSIVLLPYSTSLLSHYLRHGRDANTAAVVYALINIAYAGWLFALATHENHRHLTDDFSPTFRIRNAGLVYGALVAVAAVNAIAYMVLQMAAVIWFSIPGRYIGPVRRRFEREFAKGA
jgi:uncharacterized membrane protein